MMRAFTSILALALTSCAAVPPSLPQAAPIVGLDADFPDPALLRAEDGFYYAYATQTERDGRMINIQVARSRDLRRWEYRGEALPAKPEWASRTQDFWAPHVIRHGDEYLMYYSAKPDAALSDPARGLCLAIASAPQPEGPFADMGKPLLCGDGFINIDPMAFDDPVSGRPLLYWGSGFGPIKVQELAADRRSFASGSKPVDLVEVVKTDDPANYRRLVEGAWVMRRDGWYYLFFSGDNCCGPKAHYAVMVARSRSATGPFEIKPERGGVILESDSNWLAPGHNSVATDETGQVLIVYHAVDSNRPRTKAADDVNSRRILLIDRLVWRDGWPVISGAKP